MVPSFARYGLTTSFSTRGHHVFDRANPTTMVRLRDAHFYRRVPADVSEATTTGGVVSLVAMLTVVWLVLTQYQEYATSRNLTRLRLDRSAHTTVGGDTTIRINFNLTMNRLPCQYASVHVADHVGSHKMGGSRNVHKVRIGQDGTQASGET